MKSRIAVIFVFCLCYGLLSCAGSSSNSDDSQVVGKGVSPEVFGVNLRWPYLGDGIIQGGELVRDREFRVDGLTTPKQYWLPVATGTSTVLFQNIGTVDYYAELDKNGASEFSCLYHPLLEGVSSGVTYELNFSAFGLNQSENIGIYIVDEAYNSLLSTTLEVSTNADAWQSHTVSIQPVSSASTTLLGLCATGAVANVYLKEISLSENSVVPDVKTVVKQKIQDLGVKSLRWPGGTYADFFDWKESVGDLSTRSEQAVYESGAVTDYQVASLGLHEFLNLCEELSIEPVITLNPTQQASDAADLVEYILGDSNTGQGDLRAQNGRTLPWVVKYFEIGNEPSVDYQGSGTIEETGSSYAQTAELIADAMTQKAEALGVDIETSAVMELSVQYADWLTPASGLEVVRMLAKWNEQVLGDSSVSSLKTKANNVHGHFYSYYDYHDTEQQRFEHLMSAGALLTHSLSGLSPFYQDKPLWLTEYQVLLENAGVVQSEFTLDYQSGLVVGDILMSMMANKITLAHAFDLSQLNAFGMLKSDGSWTTRPSALVFSLLAPMAGEEYADVSITVSGLSEPTHIISTGIGNIPSNFSYDKVTAIATINRDTGKPRVVVINRDYTTDASVDISVPGYDLASAQVTTYFNADISANNEFIADNVSLSQEVNNSGTALTVQARSIVRIDYQ